MWPAVLRHDINEFFAPLRAGIQGLRFLAGRGRRDRDRLADRPRDARARPLPRARYIVNDHEPEFYATSTERALADDTYRHGLHCIAASPWLRDLLIERYGASADAFQLGVDPDTYHPLPVERSPTRSSTTPATPPRGARCRSG